MSWMKQRQGAGAPPPVPERQPYAAPQAQPFGNQQSMYPNYQGGTGNPQQQYWQMPQPPQQAQFNQQYGQTYQQDYPANANQFYSPQNQYNQNYNQYNNPQPGFNNQQQTFYQNQPMQQQNFSQKTNSDAWEDNWDWGWDEASKLQGQKSQTMVQHQAAPQQQQQQQQPLQQLPQQQPQQQLQQPPQLQQQPVFNNANVIEESFGGNDSWNWSIEEKREAKEPVPQEVVNKEPDTVPVSHPHVNSIDHEPHVVNSVPDVNQHGEEVKSLSDREAVKERLPNLALGKRFHLDNLTPQWSIESQMSQESSDGPLTQSEGTYRSENQSRNSSKSSPGLNTDNSNFNYSQPGLDEYHQNSEWSKSDDLTLADSLQNSSRRQSHDELANSMQEMRLNNHENSVQLTHESVNVHENVVAAHPPPAFSPGNFPPPVSSNSQSLPPQAPAPVSLPPPPSIPRPPSSSGSLPRPPSSNSLPRPPSSSAPLPPSSSATLPPPPISSATVSPPAVSASLPPLSAANFPPQTSSNNPFKHAGPFSHKSTSKSSASHMQFPAPMSNTTIAAPTVVNKVSQHRLPVGFEANLETTPDNSERPDQPQMSAFRPMPVTHQVPDNLEVAPQNDRNEYLQTAHLSGSDYGENTDFSRNVPPPGLRRMVVGQQESEYSQSLNISGDEPPPGLARMVPGQQTEAGNVYNQSSGNYMDRHIDGQPTDSSNSGRYRQADGQQTPDNYTQPSSGAGTDRRPIGLDRMVPGEPSNDEYSQYSSTNYGGNEQRVVTGVDHDFGLTIDAGPSDIREQNVDGSDYSEQASRNPPRNVIGTREANDVTPDFVGPPEENQREGIMEGENLQDLSIITSSELAYSREQMLDGADIVVTDAGIDRKTDISDSMDHPATSSRRQSLNRANTSGEDSERDRTFKSSPRRDRHKPSRDRDRDRDREREKDSRYPRDDKKYERDDRRAGRDERRPEKERKDRDRARDRRERDESPESRRYRRSTRGHRYETEDTDYYSDKERDRRRYREGSYTSSRPPRPDDKERRGDERGRRYNTIERDRRYDDEWDGSRSRRGDRHRDRDRDHDRDRYGRYRPIDPTRKHGNLRRDREEDRRRGDQFSSPSRPDSREATVTDDDLTESRRRSRRQRTADPYYDGYGGGGYSDPYLVQRQQYQYYEHLRLTDPAAYMALYKQLMAGQPAPAHYPPNVQRLYGEGYSGLYEGEERGSVHSGRSSTTGLKGNDTYYGAYARDAAGSLRDAPSLRTDLSDRDLNTDASLNLQLEESTVRSERMTPYRFSTAHVKGSISSRHIVVVRPSYPADGLPATVQVVSLSAALAHDPHVAELAAYPGPLVKGVTHKQSVMSYCAARARESCARDPLGHVLVWQLLALLLKQNGVVVGSDIAELLMKNTREYEYKPTAAKNNAHNESRRESSVSGEMRDDEARSSSPDQPSLSTSDITHQESPSSPGQSVMDEKAALDRLREFLIYGNRMEAIEFAMSRGLWGHALQLAAHAPRRTRALVSARFVASLPRAEPLHTLYAALAGAAPPAATCVADERWGDWRPHAAILLANATARPDQDQRTLTQLGDSLSSRGLLYSAQFCYLSAGVPWARHPLAPLAPAGPTPATPRLSLLLADPKMTTLAQFATNTAIFATEIYEYALSLNQDYVITELQVYKLLMATRLVDAGLYERALGYAEQAARALTRAPQHYSPALACSLAELADRLKYHDPTLQEDPPLLDEGPESGEPSPRHHQQWLDDVKNVAHMLNAEQSASQVTPQHQPYGYAQNQQYAWGDQAQQYQQPVQQTYGEPTEETPDYAAQYYNQQVPQVPQQVPQQHAQQEPEQPAYPTYGEDWHRTEEHHAQSYADPYWQGDNTYAYGERAARPTRGGPAPVPGPASVPSPAPAPPLPAPAPAAPPAPPAARAPPAPKSADAFELVEFHRSPALRRRIHPKPDAINVGFAEDSFRAPTTRQRTVSRGSSVDSAGSKSSLKKMQLSDLDIQIAHSPQLGTPARPDKPKTMYSTEKTPYGRVISHTVDSWARQTVHVKDGVYKPLIFGGTYPIEVPASPPEQPVNTIPHVDVKSTLDPETHRRELRKTIEKSLDKFEEMMSKRSLSTDARRKAFGKRTVQTFDIDAPAELVALERRARRDPDHKCYMSGPTTFDIDEPVSFI
ncbi:uncharacterized protein LOC115454457 isoform X3 [Manduca sexta]|uniref:uncharacterized protein LOC115454457 isoform X3 n=1 Tax=Manduca sexta TaxID=7130 RepID=UPI00188E6639|nr:uncharacterized protein LOC115454457 isoform X3 [Manduca sexta]